MTEERLHEIEEIARRQYPVRSEVEELVAEVRRLQAELSGLVREIEEIRRDECDLPSLQDISRRYAGPGIYRTEYSAEETSGPILLHKPDEPEEPLLTDVALSHPVVDLRKKAGTPESAGS